MTIIDLSHPIEDGMITYPGIPGPSLGVHLSREASREHYAPGVEFFIGTISMAANTGTYLDTPFHRYESGDDLASVPLERMVELAGVCVDARHRDVIDASIFDGVDVRGRAVLLNTGWARHWGSESYFAGHPSVGAEAAAWLARSGAALVGIDSLNIDGTKDGDRPAHSLLLEAGIPIIEHLCNLDRLPSDGFRFNAAPPAVRGLGTFPVRAYAVVNDR